MMTPYVHAPYTRIATSPDHSDRRHAGSTINDQLTCVRVPRGASACFFSSSFVP